MSPNSCSMDGAKSPDSGGPGEEEYANPFRNEIRLRFRDKVTLGLGSVFLAPIRALLVVFVLFTSWIVAKVGLIGLDDSDLEVPRKGWRKSLVNSFEIFGKLVFFSAGFLVKVKGVQASRSEAPILVGAPHSSFLEGVIIAMCKSSPVSRSENKNAILISTIQRFFQTIFVDRSSGDSRKSTLEAICKRALSPDNNWTQIFLCPEGTNTNRKVLIQFKVGAFAPGVPVQPVLIRYPGYELKDYVTWTYCQSHSYAYSVWLLLSNPLNRVELEFLPVYIPSPEEKAQPELYAKNVQALMAKHLDLRATDITYSKYYKDYCQKYEASSPKSKKSL